MRRFIAAGGDGAIEMRRLMSARVLIRRGLVSMSKRRASIRRVRHRRGWGRRRKTLTPFHAAPRSECRASDARLLPRCGFKASPQTFYAAKVQPARCGEAKALTYMQMVWWFAPPRTAQCKRRLYTSARGDIQRVQFYLRHAKAMNRFTIAKPVPRATFFEKCNSPLPSRDSFYIFLCAYFCLACSVRFPHHFVI